MPEAMLVKALPETPENHLETPGAFGLFQMNDQMCLRGKGAMWDFSDVLRAWLLFPEGKKLGLSIYS